MCAISLGRREIRRPAAAVRAALAIATLIMLSTGCAGSEDPPPEEQQTATTSIAGKVGSIQPTDGPWLMSGHDSLHTGRVDAPAISSPEIVWSKSLGHRIFAGAAIGDDGTLYVGVEGERFGMSGHGMFALEQGGDEKWSLPLPAPVRTTPLVGSDRILFGSYDGSFQAVGLDGAQGWSFAPNDLSKRISLSSPAASLDGTIYFGNHGGALQAMSYGGEPVWSFPTDDIVRAAPAIGHDGAIYFGSNDGFFYALNPDGSLRWSYKTGGRIDSAAAIAPDGTIYFGSADGKLYALTSEGALKWSAGVGKGLMVFVSPALAEDGTVYVGTTGTAPLGTSQPQQEASYPFIAFNPEGEREWEFQLGYWVRSSPTVVSDGTIYFGGWDGNLYALSPDGELRWQIALGDVPVEQGIEAQPVVAPDGTIFVGTWDGRFLAVGEKD